MTTHDAALTDEQCDDIVGPIIGTCFGMEFYRALIRAGAASVAVPMSDAPCSKCGYNGPDYYQSATHPCAAPREPEKAKCERCDDTGCPVCDPEWAKHQVPYNPAPPAGNAAPEAVCQRTGCDPDGPAGCGYPACMGPAPDPAPDIAALVAELADMALQHQHQYIAGTCTRAAAALQSQAENSARLAAANEALVFACGHATKRATTAEARVQELTAALEASNNANARLAHLADKYKWQVRDTCKRAEMAEARVAELERDISDIGDRLENCTLHRIVCNARHDQPIGGDMCICVPPAIKGWKHRADTAEAERDALRKDAERYRWLKEASPSAVARFNGDRDDAAIDAAIARNG